MQGDENRDTVAVTENSGESQFRAAQHSEYPMQRLSQQTRQGRGPNDGELNSDSSRLYDFLIHMVNAYIC